MAAEQYYRNVSLRALKGAPLSVLWALILSYPQTAGAEEIQRETGYTDKPVSQALLFLRDAGLVVQIDRTHWQLTAGARQLPLVAAALPVETGEPTRNNSESEIFRVGEIPTQSEVIDLVAAPVGENEPRVGNIPTPSRKYSDSTLSGGGGGGLIFNINKESTTTTTTTESEYFRLNFEECRQHGIWLNVAKDLAALPGVTPETIRGHCTTVENGKRIPIKWAVARIRNGADLPVDPLPAFAVPGPPEDSLGPPDLLPPDPELLRAWAAVLDQLQASEIPRVHFETWIRPLVPFERTEGVFTIGAFNAYTLDWCSSRYRALLDRLLTAWYGQATTVQFVLCHEYHP